MLTSCSYRAPLPNAPSHTLALVGCPRHDSWSPQLWGGGQHGLREPLLDWFDLMHLKLCLILLPWVCSGWEAGSHSWFLPLSILTVGPCMLPCPLRGGRRWFRWTLCEDQAAGWCAPRPRGWSETLGDTDASCFPLRTSDSPSSEACLAWTVPLNLSSGWCIIWGHHMSARWLDCQWYMLWAGFPSFQFLSVLISRVLHLLLYLSCRNWGIKVCRRPVSYTSGRVGLSHTCVTAVCGCLLHCALSVSRQSFRIMENVTSLDSVKQYYQK